MKKILLIASVAIQTLNIKAQNYTEGIRYSHDVYGGTARSISMGGAFGALGGDQSAISINPAGLGIYRSSEFTFTPSLNNNRMTATFSGQKSSNFNSKMSLENIGVVFTFNSGADYGIVSSSLAFGYNKLANFSNFLLIQGTDGSSLLDEFCNNANGVSPSNLNPYFEQIAWDARLINDSSDGNYYSPWYDDSQIYHRYSARTEGYSGEYYMGYGINISNELYLGFSFNIRNSYYNLQSTNLESDDNNSSPLRSFNFSHSLTTHVRGFNFKAGAIYRPIDYLRLGIAYHTPSWLNIEEEWDSRIESLFDNGLRYDKIPTDDDGNPYDVAYQEYEMTTPQKLVGSFGLTVPQIGLLTADCEYVDYSSIRLDPKFYNNETGYDPNIEIDTTLQSAINLRLGAEVKLKQYYIRGGYAFYGSPYKSSNTFKDLTTNVYSGGIGFRNNNFFIDLGYSFSVKDSKFGMYNSPFLQPVSLSNEQGKFVATIGFKF